LILVPSYALADLIYSYLPKEYRSRLLLTRWRSEEGGREEGGREGEGEGEEIEEVGERGSRREGEGEGERVDKVIVDIARKKEEKRKEEIPEEAKKKRILAEHASSKNSVLLSTNFWEGVDLRDDLCRFIIIPKVPYPDLSDLRNRTRLERGDRIWYELRAIMKIIQGSGRGVRHENDHCTTYILDSNASWLFKKHMKELPAWFREALSWSNYTYTTAVTSSNGKVLTSGSSMCGYMW
ncbi:MAG: helicase C-terminal domain-containing protein, partial [Candidatus Nitrosocaldus sp.]